MFVLCVFLEFTVNRTAVFVNLVVDAIAARLRERIDAWAHGWIMPVHIRACRRIPVHAGADRKSVV